LFEKKIIVIHYILLSRASRRDNREMSFLIRSTVLKIYFFKVLWKCHLYNYKWISNGYTSIYIKYLNKEITCYWSWSQARILRKGKKKKLVWTSRNFKYLVVLSRFSFSWPIRQDSFYLALQSRFFLRGKKKDSCLKSKKSWISCHSCLVLLFL
jgi:hypothetical protein